MVEDPASGSVASAAIEQLVKRLNIASKAVKLYPLSSAIPRESAASVVDALRGLLEGHPTVALGITKECFLYESVPLFEAHTAFAALAREFYNRNVAEIRFHAGCTDTEIIKLLSVLEKSPEELSAYGGYESCLWDLQVNNVTIKEVSTRVVDAAGEEGEEPEEELPKDTDEVDDLVATALARRPKAQRVLVRFVGSQDKLAAYLSAPPLLPTGAQDAAIARRVSDLARALLAEDPQKREELTQSLAEALRLLDETLLSDVLERLLADARHDDTVADVVRRFGLDELCTMLVGGLDLTSSERTELSRTIRNLVVLGFAGRQETIDAAAKAMREAGADEEFVAGVIAETAPTRLRVRERTDTGIEKPVEAVLRLLDVAGTNLAITTDQAQDVEELQAEAREGITDGDIMGALVTLVTIEDRPEHFASMMSLMENNLGLLVERQDYGIAADAAESLTTAERRPDLSEEQRGRIRSAITGLADPAQMRSIVAVMQLHRQDSGEHEACRRLLSVLGEHTMSPLLEVLAQEPDMSARKAIVDLISGMAERFIDELGQRVTDSRWYFVRNVVSILGSTKSAETLPYLERTLRHPDARVRRETIRAISGIRDVRSERLLAAVLEDVDSGNVQLAARYLGELRYRGAAAQLEAVASGAGRGNRDPETRVEAIGALARIGAASSVATLKSLARQRMLRGGRNREIRAAASAALTAMKVGRREAPE